MAVYSGNVPEWGISPALGQVAQAMFGNSQKEPEVPQNPAMFNGGLLTDRSQLPWTATNAYWWDRQAASDLYREGAKEGDLGKMARGQEIGARAAEAWLMNAIDHPRTGPEFAASWLWHSIPQISLGDEDEEAEFDNWFQNYLDQAGAGSGGGELGYEPGTPFPSISGYSPDWNSIRSALGNVRAPKYVEKDYDPMNTVANMLMNADWINMDMSKAGQVMQEAFDRRANDKARVANANEEARYNAERQNLANTLALENLRQKEAASKAELALARWQAMQPQALGGNKMVWRDSNGNLRFEAIDKNGEARTLGGNEAIAAITAMDENQLKNLTPEKIVQMAKRQSLLLQDNAAQVPWMQGYILQANDLLNASRGGKEGD